MRDADTAGTYTCNHVFYRLMRMLAQRGSGTVGGFIHVPYELSQVAGLRRPKPSMSHETITRAIHLASVVALEAHDAAMSRA